MIAVDCEQGSPDWLRLKLGVISASNIHKVLAKKGTDARASYLCDLIAQIATLEIEQLTARPMEWGLLNEEAARAAYQFKTGRKAEKFGIIFKDATKRVGCSPDLKVAGEERYGEIKAPWASRVYIENLLMGKVKNEYFMQMQFSMWVSGVSIWDFINFDPRIKHGEMVNIQTVEKDAAVFERFENEIPEFIKEMDLALEKLGLRWGMQWE